MASNALIALAEDLKHTALQLHDAIEAKRWSESVTKAKQLLGLASRTYARVTALQEALEEIRQQDQA